MNGRNGNYPYHLSHYKPMVRNIAFYRQRLYRFFSEEVLNEGSLNLLSLPSTNYAHGDNPCWFTSNFVLTSFGTCSFQWFILCPSIYLQRIPFHMSLCKHRQLDMTMLLDSCETLGWYCPHAVDLSRPVSRFLAVKEGHLSSGFCWYSAWRE